GEIVAPQQILGDGEAAVGDQVAGGLIQRGGHGRDSWTGFLDRILGEASNAWPMAYLRPMRPHGLLVPTPAGLCCRPGGFHIDPLRPVDKALITHGHSDHARPGHGAVLATQETLDFMRLRYGDDFAGSTQAVRYGETLTLGGVTVSLHPAGHVL